MQEFDFIRARTLPELSAILADTGGSILAGGTDIIPKMRRGQFSTSILIDASQIDELRFIRLQDNKIHIGAMTSHQEIANSPLIADVNPALVKAALTVGCEQTRNRGTLGGNIANASPAADAVPPLMIFDADVRLMGAMGSRTVELDRFILGPGKTRLQPGEFIHSISFSPLSGVWGASFIKLGKRKGMAISVVSASAAIIIGSDRKITDVRLCLGSVAPKMVRSAQAEKWLIGRIPTPEIFIQAANACKQDIAPISDVRSTAGYRIYAAVVLARRVLEQAYDQASQRLP